MLHPIAGRYPLAVTLPVGIRVRLPGCFLRVEKLYSALLSVFLCGCLFLFFFSVSFPAGVKTRTFSGARLNVLTFRLRSYHVLKTTYIANDNWSKSHKHMTFLVQAGTVLCFQAGRSSASDLAVYHFLFRYSSLSLYDVTGQNECVCVGGWVCVGVCMCVCVCVCVCV